MTIDDLIQELVANNNGKKDELISTIEKAANYGYIDGYNDAVNKACEWIERNYHATPNGGYYYLPEDCIEQFKQAMKGD